MIAGSDKQMKVSTMNPQQTLFLFQINCQHTVHTLNLVCHYYQAPETCLLKSWLLVSVCCDVTQKLQQQPSCRKCCHNRLTRRKKSEVWLTTPRKAWTAHMCLGQSYKYDYGNGSVTNQSDWSRILLAVRLNMANRVSKFGCWLVS